MIDEQVTLRRWADRASRLLLTIGAQSPADHPWVVESRRLLEILRDMPPQDDEATA